MSDKPEQFVWGSYWRLAWSQRPSTKALSLFRLLVAAAASAAQFFYRANSHPLHERLAIAVVFVAAYVGLYAAEVAWNFIFIAPVKLDETRRRQGKNDAVKIHCLKSELQEAIERARPKIGFQLKSEKPRSASVGLDVQLPMEAALAPLSLDVWNEGQTHVQVTTLQLENVSSRTRKTVAVNTVLLPSLPPQTVDITAELSAFLAGAPASGAVMNWEAAAGAHHIAISLHYEGGGTRAETEPKNYQLQVQSSETRPWPVKVSREP